MYRGHILEDLDCYVCLIKDCGFRHSMHHFMQPNRDSWLREILRHPQVPRWECTTHEFRTSSRGAPTMIEHMKTAHGMQGLYEELYDEAKQLLRRVDLHDLFVSCPLCGTHGRGWVAISCC